MNKRHDIEFLREILKRPSVVAMVKSCQDTLADNPDACICTNNNSQVQLRVGEGKRTWVSMRVLLWVNTHGGESTPTFKKPICETPGCISPRHQQLADEPKPFVQVIAAE